MRVYVDSSALLKRSVVEAGSDAVEEVLGHHIDDGDPLVSSSLAWIEVSRALRSRLDGEGHDVVNEAIEDALSGIAERPIAADVVSLARRIGPHVMRSLDAIHLATAVLVDADVMITYDDRLALAAGHNDVTVSAPGSQAWSGRRKP
ncbi:MAG: type II toxin-antitoxin system VapC family toxin [Actinomycetota bacterium]|nr:type II toxin-antitoxin system VapC family toxin [Actinomycetota bacterium]